jgi:two-component system nitrate/nitrite response regulator NarL
MARRIDRELSQTKAATSEGPAQPPRSRLTPRQQRVLSGICEGLGNKEIAAAEGVSETAVKATVQQLFRKMRVRRRTLLGRIALGAALGAGRHSS